MTVFGIVIAIYTIFLFFFNKRLLFRFFVFVLPFHDVNVFYIDYLSTPVRLPYFVGVLLIIRTFLSEGILFFKKIKTNKYIFLLLLFVMVIVGSEIMPFLAEGTVFVIPESSGVSDIRMVDYAILEPRPSNVTQLAYPLFFLLISISVLFYVNSMEDIYKLYQTLLLSGFFVIASGVLHIIFSYFSLYSAGEFWYRLISLHGWPGYGFKGNIFRMYSFAGEPGYTSFFLLMILAQVMVTNRHSYRRLLTRKGVLSDLVIWAIMGVIILSGGTTGIVGLIALIVVAPMLMGVVNVKRKTRYVFMYLLKVIIVVTVFIIAFVVFSDELGLDIRGFYLYHRSKIFRHELSGYTRWQLMKQGYEIFKKYPLLGVGYGSNRSLSVSTFLLSNIGIVGFAVFLMVVIYPVRTLFYNISATQKKEVQVFLMGMCLSIVTMVILMMFAKSESSMLFLYFWVLLAISSKRLSRKGFPYESSC